MQTASACQGCWPLLGTLICTYYVEASGRLMPIVQGESLSLEEHQQEESQHKLHSSIEELINGWKKDFDLMRESLSGWSEMDGLNWNERFGEHLSQQEEGGSRSRTSSFLLSSSSSVHFQE